MVRNNKKTILIAIDSLKGGGAERVASLIANQFATLGHQVHILTVCRLPGEYLVDDRVQFIRLVSTQDEWVQLSRYQQFFKIRHCLQKLHVDTVIAFLMSMQFWIYIAGSGLRFKYITTVRNNPWVKYKHLSFFRRLIWNLSYDSSDVIQVQSAEQCDFFNKKNQNKCVVIPNPVYEKEIAGKKKEYSNIPHIEKFVAAARLEPQKNYPMMLQAFAKLHRDFPSVTLDIFGVGGLLENLKVWVTENGLDNVIRLRGRSEKIFDEYLQHDVFLMSSDYEGMPNSLMEAMSVGLACISTDCPTGPKDLIEDDVNGLLVPVGDVDAMYHAMKRIVEEPGLAERLGKEALRVRERFSVNKITQQWLDIL